MVFRQMAKLYIYPNNDVTTVDSRQLEPSREIGKGLSHRNFEASQRSRRLEVGGTRKNGRTGGRHAPAT